jgi:hypothetical protein
MIFGWASHDLERLSGLDLFLDDGILSLLGFLHLLLNVERQVLFRDGLLLFVGLHSCKDLVRVRLGLLDGVV